MQSMQLLSLEQKYSTSSHFEYICVKWKLEEVVFKINNTYE